MWQRTVEKSSCSEVYDILGDVSIVKFILADGVHTYHDIMSYIPTFNLRFSVIMNSPAPAKASSRNMHARPAPARSIAAAPAAYPSPGFLEKKY